MIDREKVIRGLECCSFSWNIVEPPNCKNCPYADAEFGTCQIPNATLIDDALALLKEPAPRVLTIEEVKAYPTDKALWFEGWMIVPVLPDCRVEQQNENKLGVEVVDTLYDFPLWFDNYNLDYKFGWRCWTSKPTDEQREATPWEKG